MSNDQGKLFIISGPSGVGKTTLTDMFLQEHEDQYKISRVITYTTRQPRVNDIDGVDYHFIDQQEFEQKVADGFFLEWSGEYGACYGTPTYIVKELVNGMSKILVIDRLGAAQIFEKHSHAVLIWIGISDISILRDRLIKRNSEVSEQMQARLLLAKKEIRQEKNASVYHYHIENNDITIALEELSHLIISQSQLI